jgi:hypothetical protein
VGFIFSFIIIYKLFVTSFLLLKGKGGMELFIYYLFFYSYKGEGGMGFTFSLFVMFLLFIIYFIFLNSWKGPWVFCSFFLIIFYFWKKTWKRKIGVWGFCDKKIHFLLFFFICKFFVIFFTLEKGRGTWVLFYIISLTFSFFYFVFLLFGNYTWPKI